MIDFIKVKRYAGQHVSIVQHKLDGYQVQGIRGAGENAMLMTRGLENIWPKLREHSVIGKQILNLPQQTTFFGELHAPGVQATSVPTLINELDEQLRITAFALPRFNGLNHWDTSLNTINQILLNHGFDVPMSYFLSDPRVLIEEELKQEATKLGIEGFVLKVGHMEGWYKVKPTKTVDAFVTGYTLSESMTKFGSLKGLNIAVYDADMNPVSLGSVGSGFTDEFRFSVNPEHLIGAVVEVEYDSLAANGKLKFPRFIRFRDDKLRWECTDEQL